MNPFKKLMSFLRGPTDAESIAEAAEAERLRQERDTIRISQNTPTSQLGVPTNMPPTRDVLDPGSEDGHKYN